MRRSHAVGGGSKDTRDSRFSDLEILHWNVRGKTVQDVLDTLHGVVHPRTLLCYRK